MNLLYLPREIFSKIILFNFIKEYQNLLMCNKIIIYQFRYNFLIQKLLNLHEIKIIYNLNSCSFKNKNKCFSIQKCKNNKNIFDIIFNYEKEIKSLIF